MRRIIHPLNFWLGDRHLRDGGIGGIDRVATDRDPLSDNFNTMVSLMRDQIGVQNAQNNSFRENMSQQMELVRQQQNQITNVSIGSTMSKESSVRGSVL